MDRRSDPGRPVRSSWRIQMSGQWRIGILFLAMLAGGFAIGFFAGDYFHLLQQERDTKNGLTGGDDMAAVIVETDKPKIWTGLGQMPHDEIWLVRGKKELLVVSRGDEDKKNVIACISNPLISFDKTKVYFQTELAYGWPSVHVIDVRTKKISYVTDGSLNSIIREGKHKGKLRTAERMSEDPDGWVSFSPRIVDDSGKVYWSHEWEKKKK